MSLVVFNLLLWSAVTAAANPLSGLAEPVQPPQVPQDTPSKSQTVTAKKRSVFSRNMVIASSVSLGAGLLTWNWLASSQQPTTPPSSTNVTSLRDNTGLHQNQFSVEHPLLTSDQDDFVPKALDYAVSLEATGPLPVNKHSPGDCIDVLSGSTPPDSPSTPEPPTVVPNPQGMDLVAHYYFPITCLNPQAQAVIDFKEGLENFIKKLLNQPLTLKDFDLVQSKITPDLLNAGLQDFTGTFKMMSVAPYYDMLELRYLINENYKKFHGFTPDEFRQYKIRYAASLVPLPVVTYLYNNYLLQQGLANLKIDWLFKHDLSAAFDRMLSGQQDAKSALETILAVADAQVSSEWYKFTKLEDFRNYQRGVKLIMDVWKEQFGVHINYPRELHIESYPGQELDKDAHMCLLPVTGKRIAFFSNPNKIFRRAVLAQVNNLKGWQALILEGWISLSKISPPLSGTIKARIITEICNQSPRASDIHVPIQENVLKNYAQHYIHLLDAEVAFKDHLSSILQALQTARSFAKDQVWWLFLRDTALYLNPQTRPSCTQRYIDLALKPDEQNFYSATFWKAFLKNTQKAIGNNLEAQQAANSIFRAFEPGINLVLKQNYHLPTPFIPITLQLPNSVESPQDNNCGIM